ncbi:MAG: SIS domain-containing protein [Candidatus Heimdallarchaeota archaeon]|nr:MAG: SIS domain-containing protein [Candidatus Heimdallarchaeota archaeon]
MTYSRANQVMELSSFYSAFNLLVKTAKRTVNSINENPSDIVKFCNTLREAKNADRRVHIIGMGRSGKVGMLIGEILKNIGIKISYLGKSLAKPVRKNDVVLGITGSGWTKFTINTLQEAISRGAKILVFTGDNHSLAARLADSIILIPRGYIKEKFTPVSHAPLTPVSHAPLTPLGTVFEMTTMLVAIGVASGLRDESSVKGFNEGVNEVLRSAEMTLNNIKSNEKPLLQFINTLESYSNQPRKKLFVYGSGLDSIIASISSIRLNHLRINVKSNYDWRFRKAGDLLIGISGSGASTSTLERVESAKSADMNIIGLTSFPESELAEYCDICLKIEGRSEEVSADLRQISDLTFLIPAFEYAAAITLDSCVAQLALDLGITETEMRDEHANIE